MTATTIFLKSMLLIAWCCIRHPFTTMYIDVANGRIIGDAAAHEATRLAGGENQG